MNGKAPDMYRVSSVFHLTVSGSSKGSINNSMQRFGFIVFNFRIDVHSRFAVLMTCQILHRLRINTFVNQIGDVGVPQHVRSHLEVCRIHQLGIIRLMLTKPWLYSMLDGLSIYIGVITAFCGRTDCYVLPGPHKLCFHQNSSLRIPSGTVPLSFLHIRKPAGPALIRPEHRDWRGINHLADKPGFLSFAVVSDLHTLIWIKPARYHADTAPGSAF